MALFSYEIDYEKQHRNVRIVKKNYVRFL